MSILVEWYDNNQRIIIAELEGALDLEMLRASRHKLKSLARSVHHPVCLVCVLAPDISVPPSGFADDSKIALQDHATMGLKQVFYVTKSGSTQALWQSFVEMYSSPSVQYQFVPTLDKAISMIG